jgi:alpha-L-arabinofuranosidase
MLLDLKPRFLRFPGTLFFQLKNQIIFRYFFRVLITLHGTNVGGCFVEGDWLRNAFRWRESIGPWEERPGHFGDVWHYWTDDGLGYYEFLQVPIYTFSAFPLL